MSKAFITGSRAYGEITEKSDIDLVILTDHTTIITLSSLCDSNSFVARDGDSGCDEGDPKLTANFASLRFGKLNIIAFTNPDQYQAWLFATNALKAEKKSGKIPNRNDAVRLIKRLVAGIDL